MNKPLIIVSLSIITAVLVTGTSYGQIGIEEKVAELEDKISNLENYVAKIQPYLNEFSNELLDNVDIKLNNSSGKTVVLNPVSRRLTKIETNTGTFLIAVKRLEKKDNGQIPVRQ